LNSWVFFFKFDGFHLFPTIAIAWELNNFRIG